MSLLDGIKESSGSMEYRRTGISALWSFLAVQLYNGRKKMRDGKRAFHLDDCDLRVDVHDGGIPLRQLECQLVITCSIILPHYPLMPPVKGALLFFSLMAPVRMALCAPRP